MVSLPVAILKRTDPTYKEWKRARRYVATSCCSGTDPTYKEWKHDKEADDYRWQVMHGSYLQGMETIQPRNKLYVKTCTDPTYKEWKPHLHCTTLHSNSSTDPTYKEWKQHTTTSPSKPTACTDPTYKEWKLFERVIPALQLPCTDPTYKEWKHIPVVGWDAELVGHGSYLQGMETLSG